MSPKLPPIHPATFSNSLMLEIATRLQSLGLSPGSVVLDPFAGLGHKLAWMCAQADLTPLGVEIETGYFLAGATHVCVRRGDSTNLHRFLDNTIDAAVTSSAYPNGVSDDFKAKDSSRRHTYVHRLRSHLGDDYVMAAGNSGAMNPRRSAAALEAFYDIHRRVWAEVYRVLKPGATFLVNTKDPLKVPFRTDTEAQLRAAGFEIVDVIQVSTPGLNHGSNSEKKYTFEDITVALKPLR